MTQTIAVHSAGAVEYTHALTITETTGKDITTATVSLSLGTYQEPGTWQTPDTDAASGTSARVVQLLIDDTVTAGDYWLWSKVGDTPEVVPRRHDKITVS